MSLRSLLLLLAFTRMVASSQAAVIPNDLQSGDSYHLAFVTRDKRDADSSDIENSNQFVQEQAALSSTAGTDEGITYRAIASTEAIDARDNAPVEAPVYLLDGSTRIANGLADMWDGTLLAPITLDQFGSTWLEEYVWAGTKQIGTAYYPLRPHTSASYVIARFGSSSENDLQWISDGSALTTSQLRFYALSNPLIVPEVPEPASWIMWLGSAAMLGLFSRDRRGLYSGGWPASLNRIHPSGHPIGDLDQRSKENDVRRVYRHVIARSASHRFGRSSSTPLCDSRPRIRRGIVVAFRERWLLTNLRRPDLGN